MKRITILLLTGVLLAGAVSAEGIREPQKENDSVSNSRERTNRRERGECRNMERPNPRNFQRENTSVKIDGTIKLEKGFVSVQSGDAVYFVPMLSRFIGSIDELKDGAKVSLEGHGFKNFVHPMKVTFDNKTYIFPAEHRGKRNMPGKKD